MFIFQILNDQPAVYLCNIRNETKSFLLYHSDQDVNTIFSNLTRYSSITLK